ncbi:mCG60157, isoform CRA_a [Mus musculus]|nr:mCG60157, isoform CRA_a [Mus musculus]EDL02165.1 mCG60157, isoform CRA_a [Mus musculus]
MLVSMVPDFFPRVSTSSVASLWVFFIVSTSLFSSSMVLFISITCLDMLSCFSLRTSVWLCFPVFL